LTVKIKHYDRLVKQLTETEYVETQALIKVYGVGELTALTYVLTLGNKQRFALRGRAINAAPRQRRSATIRGPIIRTSFLHSRNNPLWQSHFSSQRREQISGDLLAVKQGTLYSVLLKLEQEDASIGDFLRQTQNARLNITPGLLANRKLVLRLNLGE
jgi:hypothetical protein